MPNLKIAAQPEEITDELFNSDLAIKKSDDDELGRKEFAWRVADVILKRNANDSIVIGIDAPWGDGKTSVLNMVVERLEKHKPDETKAFLGDNVIVLKFNPWRFSNEEKLLKNFYDILTEKIKVSLETRTEKLTALARKNSKWLKPLEALEVNVAGVGVKYNAAEAVHSLSELKEDAELEDIKTRLGKYFEVTKYKVVVIMDDIDRLNKEEMHAIFRLVKLSADIPKVTYILSLDSDMVAQALEDKYGSPEAGKVFLQKIIQVHLPLPPVSPLRLVPIAVKGIRSALHLSDIEFDESQSIIFQDIFRRAFESRVTNARLVNRLVNSLCFALPLVKGEVDILDFILIESIKVFYPDIYDSIRANILLFTPPSSIERMFDYDEKKEVLDEELTTLLEKYEESVPGRYRKGFQALIQYLFPKTEDLLKVYNRYSSYIARSNNKKRISSEEYFPRYFTYNIEPNDVSDNRVNEFLAQIAGVNLSEIADKISNFANESEDAPAAFINKLSILSEGISFEIKQTLAVAIAMAADSFPDSHPDDKQFGIGALIQAVNLTKSLITELPQNEKDKISIEIIKSTPSTMFAYDFAQRIRPLDAESSFLSNHIYQSIRDLVTEKIRIDANNETLEDKFRIYAQDLYLFWYDYDLNGLRKYAKERIKSKPNEITSLLAGILKTSLDPKKPYSYTWRRGGDFYKIITDIISEQTIVNAIKDTFGHIESEKFADEGAEKISKDFIDEYKSRNDQNLYQLSIVQSDKNGFKLDFPTIPKPA